MSTETNYVSVINFRFVTKLGKRQSTAEPLPHCSGTTTIAPSPASNESDTDSSVKTIQNNISVNKQKRQQKFKQSWIEKFPFIEMGPKTKNLSVRHARKHL